MFFDEISFRRFLTLGLIEVPIFSAAEAYHIMGMGRKNLKTAQTKLNENSSRSHAIFTIKIVKVTGKLATVTQYDLWYHA